MTTAKTTVFCCDRIVGPDGRWLWVDGNQKITALNGTFKEPKPNAFSLAHIEDCPGATEICKKSCYVHGLKKHAPDTYELYSHNSKTIREILDTDSGNLLNWSRRFAAWIKEHAKGGFRWHVSGDIFSRDYAKFIRGVAMRSVTVEQWIYTRSFEHVGPLMFVPNLQVMLSCDAENYDKAYKEWIRAERIKPGTFRLAYLSTDIGDAPSNLPVGSILFPDYPFRGQDLDSPLESAWWCALSNSQRKMVCPVDFFGKSEETRCGICRKCFK